MGSIAEEVQTKTYIVEKQGIVIEASQLFCELIGYSINELIGKPLEYVFNEKLHTKIDIKSIKDEIETYMFNKSLEPYEVIIKIQNGKLRDYTVYQIFLKPQDELLSKLQFINQLYCDNNYGIAIYDSREFTLLKANPKYFDVFGQSFANNEKCIGLSLKELIHDFEGSESEKRWNNIVLTGETVYLKDFEGIVGGMKDKYWENTIVPIMADGKVKLIVSMLIDVTDRIVRKRQLDEKSRIIEAQNKQLEAIFESLGDILLVLDKEGNPINQIPKNMDSLGISDKLTQLYDFNNNLLPIDDTPNYKVFIKGESIKDLETRKTESKKDMYTLTSGVPVFDENGNVELGVFVTTDVTDLKLQELQIKKQNMLLEVVLENINDAILVFDQEKKLILANAEARKIYRGLNINTHSEIHNSYKFFDLEGVQFTPETIASARAYQGERVKSERMVVTGQDQYMVLDTNATPIFDDNKNVIMVVLSQHDITQMIKYEESLNNRKKNLEAIIENIHDGIFFTDNTGKMTLINLEGRRQLFKPDKIDSIRAIHNSGSLFYPNGEKVPLEDLPVMRALKGEFVRDFRLNVKYPDKESILDTNAVPIYNSSGELTNVVSCSRDITETIKQQQEIDRRHEQLLLAEKEKRELLEASLKLKDEFLYLITHEFKTPLAVIDSVLQTMQLLYDNKIPPKMNKFLHTIKQNVYRQLRLVNNLLDITRINAGQIKLNRGVYDIVHITESIVKSIQSFAEQKNIKVNFESKISKKDIFIDEEKVERILLNLLSNALKFTPNGKNINVHLCNRRYKSRNMVSICVKDEGIGIPKDKQECIFERFGQADTCLSRNAEGTGIGLHLVKLFTNVMDGHIILESKEGKGSTFTVMFPALNALSLKDDNDSNNDQLLKDSRLVQSISIEFSDIYL